MVKYDQPKPPAEDESPKRSVNVLKFHIHICCDDSTILLNRFQGRAYGYMYLGMLVLLGITSCRLLDVMICFGLGGGAG